MNMRAYDFQLLLFSSEEMAPDRFHKFLRRHGLTEQKVKEGSVCQTCQGQWRESQHSLKCIKIQEKKKIL